MQNRSIAQVYNLIKLVVMHNFCNTCDKLFFCTRNPTHFDERKYISVPLDDETKQVGILVAGRIKIEGDTRVR